MRRLRHWQIRHGVALGAREQLMPVGQKGRDDFAAPAVRKQLKNCERMKLLMERWIDLATELSTLRLIKQTS